VGWALRSKNREKVSGDSQIVDDKPDASAQSIEGNLRIKIVQFSGTLKFAELGTKLR